ncbi:MAG: transglycosylase SLT domain-containing protein [Chitinispirillaceae bacterium]
MNTLTHLHTFRPVLLLLLAGISIQAKEAFPVPEIIKDNVAFWIRIYTEVSLEEGLLHDRENPQIVYEKVRVGRLKGKKRSDFIDKKRDEVARSIRTIRDSAQNKWGKEEKRIAALFKLAPDDALKGADDRIRFQTGQRERFKKGLEHSTTYLDTISAILKQHDMPDELKYLPHVESSFDPKAYSKAGAAGLWQFMRSTGRSYLRIDYLFDERRDPILSTHAAVRFLKSNYEMFESWPLAITAYNYGPNGIRRAVKSVGSNDIAQIIEKHESRTFKFASKNFYSCFVAVLQIVKKPETYFKKINWHPRFQATSLVLPFAVRAEAMCKAFNITQKQLKELNPSLRPVIFRYKRLIPSGYVINLPFKTRLSDAMEILEKLPREKSPAEGGYYTVVGGDNLYTIARRFGVSMHELAAVNNITQKSRIYVGQVLMIPSDEKRAEEKPKTALSKPEKEKSSTEIKSPKTEDKPLQDKESLSTKDTLKAPVFKKAVADPKPESSDEPSLSTHFDSEVYKLGMTVSPGASSVKVRVSVDETIGHFAEWMGISAHSIRRHNNMPYGKPIYLGDELSIPIGAESDLKKFEVDRLEYHMAIEEDFFARFDLTGLEKKKVSAGESLWRICTEAQIPLWLLKKYNFSVDLLSLKPGDLISIPQTKPKDSHTPPDLNEPFDKRDSTDFPPQQ